MPTWTCLGTLRYGKKWRAVSDKNNPTEMSAYLRDLAQDEVPASYYEEAARSVRR